MKSKPKPQEFKPYPQPKPAPQHTEDAAKRALGFNWKTKG